MCITVGTRVTRPHSDLWSMTLSSAFVLLSSGRHSVLTALLHSTQSDPAYSLLATFASIAAIFCQSIAGVGYSLGPSLGRSLPSAEACRRGPVSGLQE